LVINNRNAARCQQKNIIFLEGIKGF
jgi:hypothetical protein